MVHEAPDTDRGPEGSKDGNGAATSWPSGISLLSVDCRGERLHLVPLSPTQEKFTELWELHSRHRSLFCDDFPRHVEVFAARFTCEPSFWLEIVNDEGRHVGLLYLTDLLLSMTRNKVIDARMHMSYWDGKAAPRREMTKRALRFVFDTLNLQRLTAEVPEYAGGTRRQLLKLGFRQEGKRRAAICYEGKWRDMYLFGLTRDDLWEWEAEEKAVESKEYKLPRVISKTTSPSN